MIKFIYFTGTENSRIPCLWLDEVVSETVDKQGVTEKYIESQNDFTLLERIVRELQPGSRISQIRLYDSLQLVEIGDSAKFSGQQFVQIKFGGNLKEMLFASDFEDEFVHQSRYQEKPAVWKRASHLTAGSSPFLHDKIKFA